MSKVITIVIPCLNEEGVIGDVIKDCWIGLKNDKKHQVLIMDSSTDKSGEIAKNLGADVVKIPKDGLGQAYIDSIPYIKGDYVIMGDADGTYDFKEIDDFVKKLDRGYEFIMGTRTKGWIEKGARPKLHQYFGAPITNWIFNLVYGSKFSDIHCGLRAMTKDALIKMRLQSKYWEYASEMIIKAIHLKLKTTEVPINFYKDRKGRISNVKRQGWMTPWYAGWISLKSMFVYGADFFLYKPGILMMIAGLFLVFLLTFGPVGSFSLYYMLLGMTVSILGLVSFFMGITTRILHDYSGKEMKRWLFVFDYNKTIVRSLIITILGIILILPLIKDYITYDFRLPFGIRSKYYSSVTGLLFIITAYVNFSFSLLINSLAKKINELENFNSREYKIKKNDEN